MAKQVSVSECQMAFDFNAHYPRVLTWDEEEAKADRMLKLEFSTLRPKKKAAAVESVSKADLSFESYEALESVEANNETVFH